MIHEDLESYRALNSLLKNLNSSTFRISLVDLNVLMVVKINGKLAEIAAQELPFHNINKVINRLMGKGFWNRRRPALLELSGGMIQLSDLGNQYLDDLLVCKSGQISNANVGLVKLVLRRDYSLMLNDHSCVMINPKKASHH